MAEYYAVLSKAVAGLSNNSAETRRAVYDKARNALVGQLKAINPPLPTTEISRQRLELEEAIRRVEREVQTGVLQPRAAPPPPPAATRPRSGANDAVEPPQADGRRTPQEIFRRAIVDAEGRTGADRRAAPAEPPHLHDEPPPVDMGDEPDDEALEASGLEPHEVPPPPGRAFRETVRPPGEPRLAPDSDADRDADARPRAGRAVPEVTGADRSAGDGSHRVRLGPGPAGARGGRRGRGELGAMEQRARRSRLPALLLFGLIALMAIGLAAFGWSQRGTIGDILASLDGTRGGAGVATAPVATTPADAQSAKSNDRLLPGDAPDRNVRVVGVPGAVPATTPGGSTVAVVPPSGATAPGNGVAPGAGPAVAAVQKAALYEEPLDPAAAQSGVIAFNGTVAWSFRQSGPQGPEIVGEIAIPERKLTMTVTIRRNSDASLPASHLLEVSVATASDFAGKAIKNIPNIVLKTSEEARGDPLIGAAATVSTDVYWIALANGEREIATNTALLRDRGWMDIRLVYETGQRAILTVQKGTAGEQAFARAFAAWQTG